jgi:hypothetical protein
MLSVAAASGGTTRTMMCWMALSLVSEFEPAQTDYVGQEVTLGWQVGVLGL